VVDCRSPDKDGGDRWGSVGIGGDLSGSCRHLRVPPDIYGYLLASVGVGGNPSNDIEIGVLRQISRKDGRGL